MKKSEKSVREAQQVKYKNIVKRDLTDDDMVQFKLGLLSPAIYHSHGYATDAQYFESLSNNVFTLPNGEEKSFSKKTFERWLREINNGTKEEPLICANNLKKQKRIDAGVSRKLPDNVISAIGGYLDKVPSARGTDILRRLIKDGYVKENEVTAATVRRAINNYNLRPPVCTDTKKKREAFVVPEAGDLWVADTCYFLKIPFDKPNKKWIYVQGIIDDHSRLIVACECYYADTAENFLNTMYKAMSRYSIPRTIYVDHGSPYVSKIVKSVLNNLSVNIKLAPVRDGSSKGLIERSWLTLRSESLLDIVIDKLDTFEKVKAKVDEWVETYNHRINTGVGGIPFERYLASEARKPLRKAKSEEWLTDMFSLSRKYTVSNVGTVMIRGVKYKLPKELHSNKKVEIKYYCNNVQDSIKAVDKNTEYRLFPDDPEKTAVDREIKWNSEPKSSSEMAADFSKVNITVVNDKKDIPEYRATNAYNKRMEGISFSYDDENDDLFELKKE